MARETIVTMFSNISLAEGAKRNLIKAGFLDDDIDIISGDRLRTEGQEARHPGFWQRLFGNTLEEDQAEVYEDAMRTGGVVLSLRADEDELPRALGILDAHEELTERSAALPDDYAPGYATSDGLTAPASGTLQDNAAVDPLSTDPAHRGAARTALTGDESDEDVLRLAEERLEVGKRLVSEGSTRVRRYTVTDQVSENVSLHEQHAAIFRRPVNESGSPTHVDWSEKTVEVEETHEQPVINKTAEIIEEVVLRKETSDRVETINDSVRRQEVDIDHASTDPLGADRLTGNRTVADPLLESTRQARADHDTRPVTPGSEPAHKEVSRKRPVIKSRKRKRKSKTSLKAVMPDR